MVFAEALGGVVRLLCPLLRDKEVDPPVVVTDRLGRFFIPLIGAHRGANALAEELASLLGGVAVVATAVEAAGALLPEDVERVFLCRVSREEKLRWQPRCEMRDKSVWQASRRPRLVTKPAKDASLWSEEGITARRGRSVVGPSACMWRWDSLLRRL